MKNSLQDLLREAFKGEREAIIAFFEGYLSAEVYVPVKKKAHKEDALGFLSLEYEGTRRCRYFLSLSI